MTAETTATDEQALAAAVAHISARYVADADGYVYHDDATDTDYVSDESDMIELGRRLETDPDAYSRWCAETDSVEYHEPVTVTAVEWADVTRGHRYQAWGTVDLTLSTGATVQVGVAVGVVDSEVGSVDAAGCGVVPYQCTAWQGDAAELECARQIDGLDIDHVRSELQNAAWRLWQDAPSEIASDDDDDDDLD